MLVAVVVFSSGSSLVKWSGAPGPVVAFWRMLGASALWWAVLVVLRFAVGRPFPSRATWRATLPVGIAFGANISVFFAAVGHTSIAHAEFISSLAPILLVPIGVVVFRERLNRKALPFGLVSIVGLAIVLFNGPASDGASVGGDLLIVATLVTWVSYLAFGRRARAHVDVVDFMSTVMTIGLLVAAPAALAQNRGELWPLDGRAWAAVLLLSVLTGMIGHGLIAVAQRRLEVGTISVIQVAQPALAICWATILLGERIAVGQLPGMALVVAGLVGFTVLQQRRSPPAASPELAAPLPACSIAAAD